MDSDWLWPRIFAHRCGGALAPENTVAGLEVSAALGVRGVEFDVMLSSDRRPVVIHDDELDRCTTQRGQVRSKSFSFLTGCDAGSRHHRAFAGEFLPSLERIALACRKLGLQVNVEIKCSDEHGVETGQVVACESRRLWHGADVPPLLSSFSERALAAAREVAPDLPRALLVGAVPADWQARVAALGCVALHSDVSCWNVDLIRQIRATGVFLGGYTENDPVRARAWLAAGANALFTDRPELMRGLESGPYATAPNPLP